jgi:hypothetical protein
LDDGHNAAVVFGGVGVAGEDRLAGGGVPPELVRLDGSGSKVALEQGVAERLIGKVAAGWTRARRPSPMTALEEEGLRRDRLKRRGARPGLSCVISRW